MKVGDIVVLQKGQGCAYLYDVWDEPANNIGMIHEQDICLVLDIMVKPRFTPGIKILTHESKIGWTSAEACLSL